MDDSATILRRTTLRNLGRFLMEERNFYSKGLGEELSEKELRLLLEDKLKLALRNGGEHLDARVRAVTEETWEQGKMTGFLEGMRAGARAVLALLGEGELRI